MLPFSASAKRVNSGERGGPLEADLFHPGDIRGKERVKKIRRCGRPSAAAPWSAPFRKRPSRAGTSFRTSRRADQNLVGFGVGDVIIADRHHIFVLDSHQGHSCRTAAFEEKGSTRLYLYLGCRLEPNRLPRSGVGRFTAIGIAANRCKKSGLRDGREIYLISRFL